MRMEPIIPSTAEVTVVIPTRNRRALLEQALHSVLAQRGVDVRVIVVDEASADDTRQWLDELNDERVDLLRHDVPQGVAGARNSGWRAARTKWAAFLDDDDLWSPDKLRAQLEALAITPHARWSCTSMVIVDDRLRFVRGARLAQTDVGNLLAGLLHKGNVIPGSGSSVLADVELLTHVGGFRALESSEDWECWIRCAQAAPIAPVDRPLVACRQSVGSMSHDIEVHERAHAGVRLIHAELAAHIGVQTNMEADERYFARQELQDGRRIPAVRRLLTLARVTGRYRYAAAAAVVAASPSALRQAQTLRARARMGRGFAAEADRWLQVYRAAHADSERAQ